MKRAFLPALLLASGVALGATPVDGWYAGAFGGFAWLPKNIDKTVDGLTFDNASFKGGYDAGGRIGYKRYPLRYEGEVTWISAKINDYAINGVRQQGAVGQNNTLLAMANIYYDFPPIVPAISPLLGLGIGYAFVDTSIEAFGPVLRSSFNTNASAFAVQGIAGLTYNFAENYALDLSYRYVGTTHIGDNGRMYQANLGNAGIVYRFDEASYK